MGGSTKLTTITVALLLWLGAADAGVRYQYPDHIPQGSASLAFVFDITGSMYDDLVQVIEGAAKILATTLARREKPLHNYVLVPFHDPEIGPITSTSDPQLFQRELRDLYVQGGGDCPEMSVGAIKMALEECLPNSFIYVFTDARAKDHALTEEVLSLIQQKQSQVVFVMTGDCGNTSHPGYRAYEQIASTSSGQVFLLKKSQVNQVLNFVRVAVQSRKVNLLSVDIDGPNTITYQLPVDTKLQELTVSISGPRPRVVLRNPDGYRVNRRNGLNELLSIKQALIVNVKDPQKGVWKLQVSSEGPHTVRITGLSELDFIHGFSRLPTLNMNDTTNRPLTGVASHLLINATGLDYPGRFTKVELMSLNGTPIIEMPLVYASERPSLYNTSAFMPPDEYFFMRVTGMDHDSYDLTRSTPTAISPRAPRLPILDMAEVTYGFYDKTALLECHVVSAVPFTVQWYQAGEPLGRVLRFSDSTDVTWSIPDASSFSEGYYTCNATNTAGYSLAETYLDVKDPPPTIRQPQNASTLPGNDALLTCIAYSTVDFNMTWFYRNSSDSLIDNPRVTVFTNGSLLVRHVEKADEGQYVCRASNEGGDTDEVVHLLVQKAPVVQVIPSLIEFTAGQSTTISCTSVAYPGPTYTWLADGEGIVNTERVYTNDEGQLTFRDLRSDDQGQYTCVATNLAGTGSAVASLYYIEAPSIHVPTQHILVNQGDTATLQCETSGLPKPRLRWFRGDIEYADLSFIQLTDEGELIILGTQDMDAGNYTCVASNQAGQTSATLKLEVGSAPVLTRIPHSIGIEILTNASMPCAAKGLPKPNIFWEKVDGSELNLQGRFTVARDGTLHITGVHKSDEGMYLCRAANQFGHAETSAFLSVTGVVSPLLAYTSPRVDTIAGRTIRLQCLILLGTPRPTITWVKMGERILTGGRVEDQGNGNLVIRDVLVEDEGEYTCVASNVGGNATHVTTLDVQVPPNIVDEGDRDFTAIQDHSVRLPCQVSGDPRPQITWTKNGVRISDSDPHYFLNEDGSLEIFSADPQDTATYSCTAINVAGVKEKRLTLFVQMPPRIAKDQLLYTVIVSNPIQMPCEVRGIPAPEIMWRKEGRVIDNNNLQSGIVFLPNGALRINSVSVEDAGIYECVASSEAGNDTKLIQLMVQVPPQILSTDPVEQQVIVGQPVTLGCQTSGDPPPTVRWRKDMLELNFYDPTTRFLLDDTGSLLIPAAEIMDTGRFLCVVENPAGVVSREMNLYVYEPPVISAGTPRNTSIIENQRLTLSCPATGTPPPVISWYKENIELTGNELGVRLLSDGSIQLDAVQAEDAGLYKCIATNIAGNHSHVVELSVYLPPRFTGDDENGFSLLPESAEILLDESIRLGCPVDAIPPPTITWFRDGRPLRPDDLSDNLRIWRGGRELEISGARVEDTASYTCVARNLAGEMEKVYHLRVHVPPRFDSTTPYTVNLTVIVTRPMVIDCPAFGVPSPEIIWYKDGYEVYPDSNENLRIMAEGRRLELSVAETAHHGSYYCIAKNPAGFVRRDYELSVLVPPVIDEGSVISSPEVVVNKTIILHCPASGVPIPTVTWFKDDAQLQNDTRVFLLDEGWRLQVSKTKTSDIGRYSCRAINIAGNAEKYFDLQVLVPPSINEDNLVANPKVIVNRSVVLNCPASGVPIPDIRWMRNGEALDSNRYPSLQLLPDGRQLRVNNAQVGDTANYRCIASNKAGLAKVDFTLEVQLPVQIDKDDLVFDPKVVERQSVVLDCPATGIPIPQLSWYKEGEPINLEAVDHYRILQDGQQLEILVAHIDDAGHFECRAINEAGSDNVFYDLEVYVAPVIDDETSSPPSPEVILNHTISINCFVNGLPRPRVEWLLNGRPLDITDFNGRMQYLSDGQQLEISGAEVEDTARYTCIASNEAGRADKDFDLDVLVPPYIVTTNIELNHEVVKGRSVLLNCPAMGTPFPEVEWRKGHTPVQESGRLRFLGNGRQLEISYSEERDSGQYVCVATNKAGMTRQEYEVTIFVPPSIDEANIVDNPRVVINRTVLLECPVSGIPPPQVTWLKNSVPIGGSDDLELLAAGRQLQIARAQVTHTARYTCIASNEAGDLQRNFDLEVLVPPKLDVTNQPSEIFTVENRTVHLDCSTTGVPPPSIMWMKDRQPLLDFPYPRLRELNNGRQLEVLDVKVVDGGRYTCVITNVAGQVERDYTLKVHVPARIPNSREPSDVSVVQRGAIRLECLPYGTPEPNITWYRDGEPMNLTEARHIRILQNGRTLQIFGATVNDSAGYTCSAKNEAGQDQKLFRLQVHVPPIMNGSQRLEDISVVIDEPLSIECPATGVPEPNIYWAREGQALGYITNPNLHLSDGGSRLEVINAQLIDMGSYTCTASNVAGNVSKEFRVQVLVPPTIENGPTQVGASLNSRTILLCQTLGLPDPQITWQKDGEVIPNNGLRYRMHRSGSLEFSAVKVEDSGVYTCTAENDAGLESKEITLAVQVPPEITHDGPLELKVISGQQVALPCETTGIPKPKITWQKGSRVLSNSVGYEVDDEGSLLISRAEVMDSGIYICIAQNDAGTALGQVRLVVQVPPTIEAQQTELTVVREREVILPCRAEGVPTPTVTWEKDGEPIAPGDFHYRVLRTGRLAIPTTTIEDSGAYTCIAENDAGRASVLIDLVVQVPPVINKQSSRLVTVTEGDVAALPCESQGFPPPTISWIFDGRANIENDEKYEISENSGMLTIQEVNVNDGGSYVCTAVNTAGRDSTEILLRVQVPPRFTLLPRDQEVTANGRIDLECSASGTPTPTITWRVNNTAMPVNQPSVNGHSRLIIDNAMKRDDGTYMCVAENTAGMRRALAAVRVKVPPRVLIPPGNHAVTLAEKILLQCSVGGDPPPTILWMKNGVPVKLNSRIQQLANGSLAIYDSVNEDAGEYKCVATNEAGSSEGTALLTIRSPPGFKVEPVDLQVQQGDTVTMPCVADGEPEPQVSWRKDRVTLESFDRLTIMANNTLRIIAAQLSDSGTYICMARNHLGSSLVQAKLTVMVHGAWSPWSSWSGCSESCGSGQQYRTRACDNPSPANNGWPCAGHAKETQMCSPSSCPIDGQWSEWGFWEPCSKTCGTGERSRSRECDSPPALFGGRQCEGAPLEMAVCNIKTCPIHGGWGEWGSWLPCSETCGDGQQERYRRCDSPRTQHGGQMCRGSNTDQRTCNHRDCEVHGNWGEWTDWSGCTLSCGGGSRTRQRQCDSPSPSYGGRYCAGSDNQIDYCNREPCPVHGNWAAWGSWGDCTLTCGSGQRRRFRTCTNPPPKHEGRPCQGQTQDTEPCNQVACAVDGTWGVWSEWSTCAKTCGSGSHQRYRVCRTPQYGGQHCLGDGTQIKKCNILPCRADQPRFALANVIGNVNDQDFGIAHLLANITRSADGTHIAAALYEVPPSIGPYLQHLLSILSPVYWTTATEVGEALNGYSLMEGNFRREVQVEFATGEVLKMTHIARGVDDQGVLQIDAIINGEVPILPDQASVRVMPYVEDYIQTGPGTIYAQSSRMFRINGYSLPYAWNHTITYDSDYGRMPFLVQRLTAQDLFVDFDISEDVLQYQVSTTVARGDPSNQCPAGFFLDQDGPYCIDDDECERRSPCSHHCHNSPGSFACSCPTGYTLNTKGRRCKDINECERGMARCHRQQECVNSLGSYRCVVRCDPGFQRSSDGLSCLDIDECRETPHVCEQQCYNLVGSYRCDCAKGYRLQGRSHCVDVNECLERNPCSHNCDNTPGSYQCTCPTGFVLRNGLHCADKDECALGHHTCNSAQECVNTLGGYQCVNACPTGFEPAPNSSCIDVNECDRGLSQCHYEQSCHNTQGGYRCVCPRGYRSSGPGQQCEDINECVEDPCAYRCVNLMGTYYCTCPYGQQLLADKKSCAGLQFLDPAEVLSPSEQSDSPRFIPSCHRGYRYEDGRCQDIDECALRQRCQHVCQNTPGSYRCTCPQGYRISANGRTCQDINECSELQISCNEGQICFNRRGDYECIDTLCPENYERDPRTGYCVLHCNNSPEPCPAGSQFADVLEFRTVALPNGIPAYQDLIRLIAYDQYGVHLPRTTFEIKENDETVPFNIRIQEGKGVVYTLKPLEEKKSYRIKVQAKSYDHRREDVEYQTTFIIFISVSAFPY